MEVRQGYMNRVLALVVTVVMVVIVLGIVSSVPAQGFTPGNLIVANPAGNNILEFDPNGILVSSFTFDVTPLGFSAFQPGSLAFDAFGNLYVALGRLVLKFDSDATLSPVSLALILIRLAMRDLPLMKMVICLYLGQMEVLKKS